MHVRAAMSAQRNKTDKAETAAREGEICAVFGCGGLGLYAIQIARRLGAVVVASIRIKRSSVLRHPLAPSTPCLPRQSWPTLGRPLCVPMSASTSRRRRQAGMPWSRLFVRAAGSLRRPWSRNRCRSARSG
ncbi:hypothetical protein MES5069_1320022 [Mesorhizobium escarrei]|uniref:Alcohol dehydrogenase-like C-terminal domain-containing protein n=1 Tax=Mesorhizobium escarrei TaxID=666018 RepID=A0ABN8JE98_9HYPH|nr:hypothetical protein MES5069_1320022 [Mesorhizobium escarrei]